MINYCLDILKSHYFTWKNWANFTDDGDKPALKKYHYVPMAADSTIAVSGTNMNVTAFPLSHGNPYQSTAFLLQYQRFNGSDLHPDSGRLTLHLKCHIQ